jgi:hypothetical protein
LPTGAVASNQNSIDATIAQIVEARDYTAQYVVLAKQAFKPSSAEYTDAFKLYADAYAKYGAWDAYVSSALRAGRSKKLTNNPDYQAIATDASHSAIAFTGYVDSNTNGQAKAVTTILASLADLGLKLWTGISTQITQQRTTAANAFDAATSWQSWAQITDGSQPKPVETKPTNTTSTSGSKPATGATPNSGAKAPTKPKTTPQ